MECLGKRSTNSCYYSPLDEVHKSTTISKLTEYFNYSGRKCSHNPK